MYFVHHLATFIMAWFGFSLGLVLAKRLPTFLIIALLLFGIGEFIHVMILDAPIYMQLYDNNVSAYERYIIRGEAWQSCSVPSLVDRIFTFNWNEPYSELVVARNANTTCPVNQSAV